MIRLSIITPFCAALALQAAPLDYSVSWLGNSFSSASNKWVQNFFIHTRVQPDGTVNTWSHWDEGGKKFGVYRDGDVVGNTNINPNSLETTDKLGRKWKIAFDYVEPKFHEYDFKPKGITCDGEAVEFPGLFEPMALALAKDGQLMVADSQTSPRQQVLFYDITQPKRPMLTRAFGDYGGIASGKPGEVTPTKFWGIRGIGMDALGKLYVAMSEMGTCLRKFSPEGKLLWELRGDFFVDIVCGDTTTDGRDVWGIQEHYMMDYATPPGQEAKLGGYSLDRHKYPRDPAGTDVCQTERRTRPYLAAGRLLERPTISLRWRYVRQQLHQHFSQCRRTGGAMRSDSPVGQQSLSHRTEVAAQQAQGNLHLARSERRRRLPDRRVRAEHRTRATRSVLGGQEGLPM